MIKSPRALSRVQRRKLTQGRERLSRKSLKKGYLLFCKLYRFIMHAETAIISRARERFDLFLGSCGQPQRVIERPSLHLTSIGHMRSDSGSPWNNLWAGLEDTGTSIVVEWKGAQLLIICLMWSDRNILNFRITEFCESTNTQQPSTIWQHMSLQWPNMAKVPVQPRTPSVEIPPFDIDLFPTGDEDSGFHTQNDPSSPYQQTNVIQRKGSVDIRCSCIDVVHRKFDGSVMSPSSMRTAWPMRRRLDQHFNILVNRVLLLITLMYSSSRQRSRLEFRYRERQSRVSSSKRRDSSS